jgi:shikimate kinase
MKIKSNIKQMRYILVGHRSVGKTTIGRLLAKKLNYSFFDVDTLVEKKLQNIDAFIEEKGLASYRYEESKILKELATTLPGNCILSVGGGTVASQFLNHTNKNQKILKNLGIIIYLTISKNKTETTKILFEREQKRKGNKTFEEIKKLVELRQKEYETISDYTIECEKDTPQIIVKKLCLLFIIKKHNSPS